jgi:GxxExxY protein
LLFRAERRIQPQRTLGETRKGGKVDLAVWSRWQILFAFFAKNFAIFAVRKAFNAKGGKVRKYMDENSLSNLVINRAIKVHQNLGPGLLESSYQECLFYELGQAGLFVEKEKALPLIYEEVKLECGYRIDIFVERKLVLEIKAVDAINDMHLAQVLTYLKLSNCKLGLLLNFNVLLMKNGIRRVANGL